MGVFVVSRVSGVCFGVSFACWFGVRGGGFMCFLFGYVSGLGVCLCSPMM